ncbi:MAG: Mth938-like domain-containing protein [Thiobacillus sp.]
MKLHLNTDANLRLFTGYGDDHVLINGHRHESSLLLTPRGVEIAPWAGLDFEALTAAHFEWVALRELDILLLGTGTRLRFPHPSLTRALVDARIGLEVMDIGALCRTYNFLIAEGRNVGAAVLIEPANGPVHLGENTQ